MKRCVKIQSVKGLEVLDSRGNPTVQVEVCLENGVCGKAMVPSGASTGSFEAVELRDNDKKRYIGKGVLKAVSNVNSIIASNIAGENVFEQEKIDKKLIELDGTVNKEKLGANAILGTSLAIARAASHCANVELYRYLGGINAYNMPIPMMNILNGGKHADSTLSVQEFMIMPIGAQNFRESIRMCVEIYHTLKNNLKEKKLSTSVGDEGGFAPNVKNENGALDLIIDAIKKSGYKAGEEVFLALDVAANEMFEEAVKIGEKGKYYFWKTGEIKNANEMISYLENLVNEYPIYSIEDGLAEEDWGGWKKLTSKLGSKIQLVGDDLFVTNSQRLQKGIDKNIANSILIKPNQIGTLTETLNTINLANENGYSAVLSHRSGETEDTFIADLAVATNVGQIKTGAPCRTDRVAKYNRLLNIESNIH